MADVLTYRVSAGPAVDNDVVERWLLVTVDGASTSRSFPPSTTDFGEINVAQNATVVLSLVDVDDAGNRSEAATVEFQALDTIAPAAPGSFGVTLVRETTVSRPAAPSEPEVTPPAPSEPEVTTENTDQEPTA